MIDPGAAPTGIGQTLKTAREARDLNQQDVSDSLNLLVRVIDDIEKENWGRLPSTSFCRGYLRAYAKLLGIDGDDLLRKFDAVAVQVEMRPVLHTPAPRFSVSALIQKQPGAVLSAAVALVVCSVLVVLWAVWPHGTDSAATAAALPAVAAPRQPPPLPAPPRSAVADAAATPLPDGETALAGTAEPASDAAGEAVRRISAEGDDRLDFEFAQDSWVEVKDRAGQRVFADLGRAGDSLQLIGQAPFAIVLGNAPGVDLSFNGERVALSPHTRNNIATLALGQ